MARALTAEWQHVEPADEPEAARAWRAKRQQLARDGCNYWIFRSPTNPAEFLEFIEAADAEVLRQARSRAGMNPSAEILSELELS